MNTLVEDYKGSREDLTPSGLLDTYAYIVYLYTLKHIHTLNE